MITNQEAREIIPPKDLRELDALEFGEGGDYSCVHAPGWVLIVRPGVKLHSWSAEEDREFWLNEEQTWDPDKITLWIKGQHPEIASVTKYVREKGE